MDSEQKDRTQVIIESLITTLGNREQKNQRTGKRERCLENKSGNCRKKSFVTY